MRVARAARGRQRALIALKLLPNAACCIFMGVWGAYIRPPNRMHTSPFILITLKAPHIFSNASQSFESPQCHQLFPQGEFSSLASFEGVSF